jgi:hypothetical protein
MTPKAKKILSKLFLTAATWTMRPARDLALNIVGFFFVFAAIVLLGIGVRTGLAKLLEGGHLWPALIFALFAAGGWAMLFGLVRKDHLRNPEGKVLPLPAVGFLLGGAGVWVYIFAGVSYALMRLGVIEYAAPPRPEDLLYLLTDAYSWYFLDLLPGLNITSALGWKCPVELQGGGRGVLLVLFRAAVIYQVFAKGREFLEKGQPASVRKAA